MQQSTIILIPPWVVLAALLGVMHAALFHLLFGNRIRRLPLVVVIGFIASLGGGFLGTMIPPAVLSIGETNLIATGLCAWAALGLGRLFRYC